MSLFFKKKVLKIVLTLSHGQAVNDQKLLPSIDIVYILRTSLEDPVKNLFYYFLAGCRGRGTCKWGAGVKCECGKGLRARVAAL